MNGKVRALALGALLAAGAAHAAEGITHTVSDGDTLIGLARRYLGDEQLWPRIQRANPGVRERYLQPGTQVLIPAPAAGSGALVLHVSGQATLLRLGVAQPLHKDMEVRETDEVRVQPGGYVTLRWPEGIVTHLLPGTVLKLTASVPATLKMPAQRALELTGGTVESQVPRQEPPSRYQIRTRFGAAGVRGTQFGVRAQPAGMVAEVTEGSVELAGAGFRPVQLPAGTGAVADGSRRPPQARPMLPAPALEDEILLTPESALQAEPVPGAAGYELQVATGNAPPLPILQRASATPAFALEPLRDGRYQVQLRAVDAQGIPGRIAQRPMTLITLASPFLSEPAMDAVLPEGLPGRLLCSDVPNANRYEFEVRSIDPPREPLRLGPSAACDVVLPALPAGRYEWRASAARELPGGRVLRGAASAPGRFSVVARPPAPAVRVGGGQGLLLMWDGAPDAKYLVQVARDLEFTQVVSETMTDAPQASLNVPGGQSHYVRIRALSGAGLASDFSPPRIIRGPLRLGTSDGGAVRASDGSLVEPQ